MIIENYTGLNTTDKLNLISKLLNSIKSDLKNDCVETQDFNFEGELISLGFEIDIEKDERTTLIKNHIHITLHHDSFYTDDEGCPDYISIFSFSDKSDSPVKYYYRGKSPKSAVEVVNLFNSIYLDL